MYQLIFSLDKPFRKEHLAVFDILPVECDERQHIVRLSRSFVHRCGRKIVLTTRVLSVRSLLYIKIRTVTA